MKTEEGYIKLSVVRTASNPDGTIVYKLKGTDNWVNKEELIEEFIDKIKYAIRSNPDVALEMLKFQIANRSDAIKSLYLDSDWKPVFSNTKPENGMWIIDIYGERDDSIFLENVESETTLPDGTILCKLKGTDYWVNKDELIDEVIDNYFNDLDIPRIYEEMIEHELREEFK